MGQDASKGASLAPPVKACHPGAVRRLSRSPSVTSSTSSSAPVDVQLRVRSVSCVDQHNKQSQQDIKQRQVMALLDVIFKALDSNHDGFVDRYDVLQWVSLYLISFLDLSTSDTQLVLFLSFSRWNLSLISRARTPSKLRYISSNVWTEIKTTRLLLRCVKIL